MPLALPHVTLCALTAINHELTARAMVKCLEHCSFAHVVMLSTKPVDAPFHVEVIPHFGGVDYAPLVCRILAEHTPSSHNLLVQYDSHIIEPAAWDNVFLDYDYIGAKWPWHPENRRVGNSGFCLRSRKLLDITASMPLPETGTYVDDTFICHTMRQQFEQNHCIKIAPEAIADRFAYERHTPTMPTFGFHGIFNFWRHTDDAEMMDVIDGLDDIYVPSRAYAEVVFRYYDLRKFRIFSKAYQRLRKHIALDHIKGHLLNYVKDGNFIDALIKCGESLPVFA
jgi:hypothetical protein